MKIIFIGGRDVRILGGIENYMLNLATQLVRLGHEPIVCCESDHNATETICGFEVRFIKGPKSNLICKPWVGLKATLRAVFRDKDVDLIHYNAWPPSLWCWIARLKGIPSLMEGHGLEWQRSKYGKTARRIMKFMEGLTAQLNRNLVMCSEDQVRYFKETYGRDSVCIPGAVNMPAPDAGSRSDILNRFSLTPGRYFLFMGRLVQDKNPDCLIRAFLAGAPAAAPAAASPLAGFKLVIAGDNAAMPDYVEYLHGITDNPDVVFTGAVYGSDKAALLRNAFAFCLPSTMEGLSIVLMEAVSYRLPVIASDIPANRELLRDNAIYVRPENEDDICAALSTAIENPDFSTFTAGNFKRLEAGYTWEKVARKYMDHVSKLKR